MSAERPRGGSRERSLAAPGIPELLLSGRERAFLTEDAIPSLTATPGAFTDADVHELVRAYSLPDDFRGAAACTGRLLRAIGTVGFRHR